MKKIQIPGWAIPIIFLLICFVSYGLLIPWLGFYMDDWYLMWFSKMFGPLEFIRYFAQDRPFLSGLYIVTNAILGQSPLVWQIFAIVTRWLAVLSFWWMGKQIWPGKIRQVTWAALIFAVYPGFKEQWMAVMFSHEFIIMALYLISFACLLFAIRTRPRWFWPLMVFSVICFAVSLFSSEYYFGWEVLRPIFVWLVLVQLGIPKAKRIAQTAAYWAPYLVIWFSFWVWRTFFFVSEQHGLTVLRDFAANPKGALVSYLQMVLQNVQSSGEGIWEQIIHQPHAFEFNNQTTILYWLIVVIGILIGWFLLSRLQVFSGKAETGDASDASWAWQAIGIGVFSLFFAGIPFWAAGLNVDPTYPLDRFTLAMMLGASLALVGAIELLIRTRPQQILILAVIAGLAIGMNFQTANTFRRESIAVNQFIWQLAWRAPGVKPGTVLLTHELPFNYNGQSSLTAAMSWVYAPYSKSRDIPYFLIYTNSDLAAPIIKGTPEAQLDISLRVVKFTSVSGQVLSFYYSPPGCLRIMDPDVDSSSPDLPLDFLPAIPISNLGQIEEKPANPAAPQIGLFGAEPGHDWCYFFEKADLARQEGDWAQVTALGNQASQRHLTAAVPLETLVFAEGYAHTGQWDQARNLSLDVFHSDPTSGPRICKLWSRISQSTPSAPEQQPAVQKMLDQMNCLPFAKLP
jgi:hypothetical protein